MRLKAGVRVLGTRPETILAMQAAAEVLRRHDVEFVVTSVTDGRHSRGSAHYAGNAFDFRTRHMGQGLPARVRAELTRTLGGDLQGLGRGIRKQIGGERLTDPVGGG